MLDMIIRNGSICDGSGQKCYSADIGIKNQRIYAIGTIKEPAREEINAEGLVVAPGFIDIHTHSEIALLCKPEATAKISQGITTEIAGNCGISAFPLADETKALSRRYSSSVLAFNDRQWNWNSLDDYFGELRVKGSAVNMGTFIGHGSLRIAVMGFDNRKPSSSEMEKMRELLKQMMEQGAFGLTTGLAYVPGSYADINELSKLVDVVAQFNGLYATHLRNQSDLLVECVEEAIEIGKNTGASIQISHLKAVGKDNQKNALKALKVMGKGRENGINVAADQYPYLAGSSTITAILPPWSLEGGMDSMINKLKQEQYREKIKYDIQHGIPGWENRIQLLGWGNIYASSVVTEKNKYLEGKNLKTISEIVEKSPEDALFDLLIEENGNVGQIVYTSTEETLQKIMQDPWVMIGSDGLYVDCGKNHPRLYGSFPRVLGEYVREKQVLTLEEAIRKMTSLPASRLGLYDRGLLQEGMFADITIFDRNTIADRATFDIPDKCSKGIEYVLVNGELVFKRGKMTGKLPGKIVKQEGRRNG